LAKSYSSEIATIRQRFNQQYQPINIIKFGVLIILSYDYLKNMQTKDVIDLPLALQDYMPIAFVAIGLYFIYKMISQKNINCGYLALVGGILITLGGTFKATWKLIQALGGKDIPFFNNSLFVLLAAGFICVAWALWKSHRRNEAMTNNSIWSVPIFLIAVAWAVAGYVGIYTASRAWFFILLGITTFANIALLLQLIYRASKAKLWFATMLFVINLIVILGLSRSADQSVTAQWFKQINTTLAQGSFAFASWILANNESQLWQRLKTILKYYFRIFRFTIIRR
jgi:hypothetical protein